MLFFGVGSSELSDIPRVPCDTDHSQSKVGQSDCYWFLGYPKMNSMFLFNTSFVQLWWFATSFLWSPIFGWFVVGSPTRGHYYLKVWLFVRWQFQLTFSFSGGKGGQIPNLFHVLFVKSQKPKQRETRWNTEYTSGKANVSISLIWNELVHLRMGCGQSDCEPSEAAEIQDLIVWRKIQNMCAPSGSASATRLCSDSPPKLTLVQT